MSNLLFRLVMGAFALVLCGCGSTSRQGKGTTADLMRAHAVAEQAQVDQKNRLAKDWERGAKLVESGEKLVKEGEKKIKSADEDLSDGRRKVQRGNREIQEGRRLMDESEGRFQKDFTPPANPY